MALLSALTLENFRTFRRRTTFDLAPLTILTGPNSSGKSSLLKALLFLRHNARTGRLHAPSFTGGGHKLGSLHRARFRGSESDRVRFGVAFDWGDEDEFEFLRIDGEEAWFYRPLGHVRFDLDYDYSPSEWHDLNYGGLRGYQMPGYTGYRIDDIQGVQLWRYSITAGPPGSKASFFTMEIVRSLGEGDASDGPSITDRDSSDDPGEEIPIMSYYRVELRGDWLFESPEAVRETLGFPEYGEEDAAEAVRLLSSTLVFKLSETPVYEAPLTLDKLVEAATDPSRWADLTSDGVRVSPSAVENPFLVRAVRLFVRPYLTRWTEYLTRKLGEVDHVGVLRTSPQRFYPDEEPGAFTVLLRALSVDPHGERLRYGRGWSEMKRLLQDFGIGRRLVVDSVRDGGYTVMIEAEAGMMDLADIGYGHVQLIPLILYAVFAHDTDGRSFPTLLVEEPEASLHPNLQAKLADLFVAISQPEGSHTVVETHSEYLIRRLQYLVAKGEVEPKRVTVYYLGPNPEAEDYVRRIEIDQHGRLSQDFGSGFVDEATNLMVALYKHGRQN